MHLIQKSACNNDALVFLSRKKIMRNRSSWFRDDERQTKQVCQQDSSPKLKSEGVKSNPRISWLHNS